MVKRQKLSRPITDQGRIELDIAVHDSDNKTIILNMPGYNEDSDGLGNKYLHLADLLQDRNMGTIVRLGNKKYDGLNFASTMRGNLRFAIDYCQSMDHFERLYLMGFSAGASAIAAVAADYPSIEKILLVAPSCDAGLKYVEKGLKKYRGEAYFATGENDDIADPDFVRELHDLSYVATRKQFVTIPNCNHNFSGEDNSRVISKAPFWAFREDETFPSPEGGTILYN